MIEEKDLQTYFGKQPDYYLEKYKLFRAGEKYSFNTGAFLAGIFWFFYRKLWFEAIAFVFILIFLGIIENELLKLLSVQYDYQQIYFFFSNFIIGCIFGSIGNYLYFKKAEKDIKNLFSKNYNENERLQRLRKFGGTSWAPVILIFIIIGIILLVEVV